MFHSMKLYECHNGSSAADWLGTAATAARTAAAFLEDIRNDRTGRVVSDFDAAERYLAQALEEIAVVRERLGIAHAQPRLASR